MSRTLPNGKEISSLGFGCSSLWAKPQFDAERADDILEVAFAHGINHFDTSPSYGWGEGERRLGRLIGRKTPDRLVLSTKIGTFMGSLGRRVRNFTPALLERSFTTSLKTLGVERVDILYLHGPYLETLNDEIYRFFENEKTRGRIVYSGANSFDRKVISAFISSPLDVIMLQYNVADMSSVDLFDDIVAKGKVIVAGTILAQGIAKSSTFFPRSWKHCWYLARALKHDPLFALKGYRISRALRSLGLTASSDPLRFVLSDTRVSSGVFGTSNREHVIMNARAASMPLDKNVRATLLAALCGTPSR